MRPFLRIVKYQIIGLEYRNICFCISATYIVAAPERIFITKFGNLINFDKGIYVSN